jgi:beta-carotene hydroxylase
LKEEAALRAFRADPVVQELAQAPTVAWPTVAIAVGYIALVATCWYLILTGQENPIAVILLIGVAGFFAMTPVHEASHGLLSRNLLFNDILGSIVSAVILPGLTSVYYRWEHNQHHKYLGQKDKDLDLYLFDDPHWKKPFTWFFGDYRLAHKYVKIFHTRPQREKNFFYASLLIVFSILAWGAATGHLLDIFLYWFIPSRIALLLYSFLFGYVPHAPGYISENEEGPFKASRTVVGMEWLLTPGLLFQNYHLIHHLIPTAPFYRYAKIWRAKKDFLIEHDALITHVGPDKNKIDMGTASA